MNQITNFWNHFKQNNFVFLLLDEIPNTEIKVHFNILIAKLHLYSKDLDIIIKNKNKGAEIIITANGNPYLFKEVALLIHHAPTIHRWKITALLQPDKNIIKYENKTDKPFEFYGIVLLISEMYFIPLENLEKPTDLGIRIYLKNYIVHKDNPYLREAVYIQLEHLIGEKSFARDIAFVEMEQVPSNYEELELIELYNLAVYIENVYRNIE